MKGVEGVFKGKKLVAIVFHKNLQVKDIEFFTDNDNPLQIGAHNRKKGTKLTPHVHIINAPITVNSVQEWLLVQKGQILVVMYTEKGKVIDKKTLSTGDSILLMEGGHGVEFLKNSRIFEIKQGPYVGVVHSKIFIK